MQDTNERKYLTDEELQAWKKKKALTEEELRTIENVLLKADAVEDLSTISDYEWEALLCYSFDEFFNTQPIVIRELLDLIAKNEFYSHSYEIKKFLDTLPEINRALTALRSHQMEFRNVRTLFDAISDAADEFDSDLLCH